MENALEVTGEHIAKYAANVSENKRNTRGNTVNAPSVPGLAIASVQTYACTRLEERSELEEMGRKSKRKRTNCTEKTQHRNGKRTHNVPMVKRMG